MKTVLQWFLIVVGGVSAIFVFALGINTMTHLHWISDRQIRPPETTVEEMSAPEEPLPPMPDQADLGDPEPEEREEAGQMHMRQARDVVSPGWCSHFCFEIGARQLHPDAFRRRLRSELTMDAEMDTYTGHWGPSPPFQQEGETYDVFAERVARSVEARFGEDPICSCEADGLRGHWILAVPRERAVFFDGPPI